MIRILLRAAALLVAAAVPAHAEVLEVSQVALGMECAECARNLRVEVGRLDGVQAASASWNRRVLTVRFARGNKTTLAQLRAILRRHHFVPGEAEVTVAGRVRRTSQGDLLLDGGEGAPFLIEAAPGVGLAEPPAADRLLVTGRVAGEPRGAAAPARSFRLSVLAVRPQPGPS
jgi:hypothetical protein